MGAALEGGAYGATGCRNPRYPARVSEQREHLELNVDAVTASWLRRHCSRREGLADVAAAALRDLAMAEAVDNLTVFYDRQGEQWVEDSVRETETAVVDSS